MITAYVGLGSNLDCPASQLSSALSALQQLPQTDLVRYSSYYLSKPLGPQDQPDYINAAAELKTALTPANLLENMLTIETQQGRKRGADRWGPRTLDLDLLMYGNEKVNEPELKIPHPEMGKRNFVLAPLVEIAPELEIPGMGLASELLQEIGQNGLKLVVDNV